MNMFRRSFFASAFFAAIFLFGMAMPGSVHATVSGRALHLSKPKVLKKALSAPKRKSKKKMPKSHKKASPSVKKVLERRNALLQELGQ